MKRVSATDQNNLPLINLPAPTNGGDATNKTYVDTQVSSKNTKIEYTVGVTDADFLVGSYATFSHAVNAALALGNVYIKAGSYTVPSSGSVTITPVSGRTIRGAGIGLTTITTARTDYVIKNTASALTDFTVSDLTINCQNLDQVNAMRFQLSTRVKIERCKFINAAYWFVAFGNEPSATSSDYNYDCEVNDCTFDTHSSVYEAILVYNSINTVIDNCIFRNNAANSPVIGMWQLTDATMIRNCKFYDCVKQPIYYSNTSDNLTIENCYFKNCGSAIVGGNASDNGLLGRTYGYNLKVLGCHFIGGANSVTATAIQFGAVDGCIAQDNTIELYESGIKFSNGNTTAGTPVPYPSKNGLVSNNIFKNMNPGNNVHALHNAIVFTQSAGNGVDIYENKVIDDQATKTLRYAVSFNTAAASYANIRIHNNDFPVDTANSGTSIRLNDSVTLPSSVLIYNNNQYYGTNPRQIFNVKTANIVYNVADFGAVADGTTSDVTAIKAAMDAAHAAGGGIVQLMAGTHAFGSSITGAYKNITVRGHKNTTVCKATTSFTNGMFNCDASTLSTENMVFENIILDCNNQTNVIGVSIKGGTYSAGAFAKNFIFRGIKAKNLATVDLGLVTIYTGRGTTDRGPATDMYFEDCDFQETVKYHVYVIGGQAKNYQFNRCIFRNSQYGCVAIDQPNKKNSSVALGTRSSQNWIFKECSFSNNHLNSTALFAFVGDFTDSNRSGIRSLKFDTCRFEGNGASNTTIEQYAMSIHSSWDVIIVNCTFWKIRTFLNIGQSYNGPWYQEDGTQFLTIRDNTFYQLFNIVDHDSAFFATWDNNKFVEIYYGGIGGYSRHWPSIYTNNYFYNTPADPTTTGYLAAAFYVGGRDGLQIRNNIAIDDRLLSNPTTAPTLSQTSGGALASRTYYVKYAYRNDIGATLVSSEANLTVSANNLLKFDFPYTATYGPPSGAKWVDIYIGTTAGTGTLQTSQPVAWNQETETVLSQNFGPITWTEPTTGLVSGAAMPSSNTTATIMKYLIYENDTEGGGPHYINNYRGNRAYGMQMLRRNAAWSSDARDNTAVPNLATGTIVETDPISLDGGSA